MWFQLLIGALVSFANFAIHALMTVVIVMATRRTAHHTSDRHVFVRLTSLLTVTMVALMIAHIVEIAVWALYYNLLQIKLNNATGFEFAFENYTALGYGDALPIDTQFRLSGPITALNGLLLIGWSIAIIFEVMRMAEVQFGLPRRRG